MSLLAHVGALARFPLTNPSFHAKMRPCGWLERVMDASRYFNAYFSVQQNLVVVKK